MRIRVMSREMIEGGALQFCGDAPQIVISITDPGSEDASIVNADRVKAIFRHKFHDVSYVTPDVIVDRLVLFTEGMAKEIVSEVLGAVAESDEIVVHCEAGISRSAGVAAALSKWYNGSDDTYFRHYLPNRRVYRMMLEALNGNS